MKKFLFVSHHPCIIGSKVAKTTNISCHVEKNWKLLWSIHIELFEINGTNLQIGVHDNQFFHDEPCI
jgi:hypothetical protein